MQKKSLDDHHDLKNDSCELYFNEDRNGFLNSAEEDVGGVSKFDIGKNIDLMIAQPTKEAANDLPAELNKQMTEWLKHHATIRAM